MTPKFFEGNLAYANCQQSVYCQHVQGNDSGEFLHLSLLVRGVLQERNPCLFKAAPNGKIPVCKGIRQSITQETECYTGNETEAGEDGRC